MGNICHAFYEIRTFSATLTEVQELPLLGYSERDESCHTYISNVKFILILTAPVTFYRRSVLPTAFLISAMSATCPAHLILPELSLYYYLTTSTNHAARHKSVFSVPPPPRPSLSYFNHSPQHILHRRYQVRIRGGSSRKSAIFSVCSFLNVTNQV